MLARGNVSLFEPPSHTFLLRIWIEEIPQESGRLCWRGSITHFPDEDRRYVQTFDQVAAFIWDHIRLQGHFDETRT
jgi:hypothetical protein